MKEQNEEWVDVFGYDGLYQVSTLGRVKSMPRIIFNGNGEFLLKERIRKINKHNRGGLCVCLSKNGKLKTYKVNKLVYESFVGECKYLIHLDGDQNNCQLDNLRAITEEQFLIDQAKRASMKRRVKNYYALIDYGRCSGKHPFVYKVFTKSARAQEYVVGTEYKREDIIKITKEEYDYIMKFDSDIEVLFNEYNRFFI